MSNVLLSPSNSTLSISNIDQKITLNNNQEVNINGKAFIVSLIDSQSAYPDYAIMFSKTINPTSIDDIYSLTTIDGLKYIQNAVIGSVYVVVYFKSATSYGNYYVDISIGKSPYAYVHPFIKLGSTSLTSIDISNIVLHIKYNYVLMTDEYLPTNTSATPTLESTTTFTYINYNAVIHNNVYIGNFSLIGSHCVIENNCYIASSKIGGDTHIKQNCFLGLNSSIRDKVTIGEFSIVGMGCSVNKSINPYTKITIDNNAIKISSSQNYIDKYKI